MFQLSRPHQLFLFLLLLFLAADAQGHVIGIDFGSEYIKVAGPHGEQSFDIILNEFSQRKTENMITFRNGERFIGEQAKKLAARFPLLSVGAVNLIMGLQKGSKEVKDIEEMHYQKSISFSKRGSAEISVNDTHSPFSGEELYSMMLSYFYKISLKDGVTNPKSIVITIPFNASTWERRAILEAARFADLNVLGLIHPTTAAAFYYGMRHRGFGNRKPVIIVFDIGATHTEAGAFTYSPSVGARSSSRSFGTLTTVAILRDQTLGSRAFDLCLAKIIEQEAMEKLNIESVFSHRSEAKLRSQFSLLRAANKVRETLSVNTEIPYTVEGIAPDKGFSSFITREVFQSKCSHLFVRIKKLAFDVIAASGYEVSQISAFEMMGGLARTPKIISDLSSVLGRNVDRTLNMDEAAALGAAYYAVRLSPFYRSKWFRLDERVPQPIYFFVEPRFSKRSPRIYRELFAEDMMTGSSASVTLKRIGDFTLTLLNSNTSSKAAANPFARIEVKGVRAALEKMNFFTPTIVHPNNSHAVRIQLRVNESGLIELEEADIIVKYAANMSQTVFKNLTDTDGNEIIEPEEAYSVGMRYRFLPLPVSFVWLHPRELTEEEAMDTTTKLYGFEADEKRRHETNLAKNNLEAYVFWAKGEGILENNEIDNKTHEIPLARLAEALNSVSEWLEYGHGSMDTCKMEEYNAQLSALKELVNDVTGNDRPPEIVTNPLVPGDTDTGDEGDL